MIDPNDPILRNYLPPTAMGTVCSLAYMAVTEALFAMEGSQ